MLSKEQLRILKSMDVDAALKIVANRGFIPDAKIHALAGLHKARVKLGRLFTEEEVTISRRWLEDNNYNV